MPLILSSSADAKHCIAYHSSRSMPLCSLLLHPVCCLVDSSVIRYHRSSHKDVSSRLSAFSAHDSSAICASGSHKPFIEIFDHAGATLDTIKYHVGFLGQRIGPISTLAFHS
jgi:hypothetical protein